MQMRTLSLYDRFIKKLVVKEFCLDLEPIDVKKVQHVHFLARSFWVLFLFLFSSSLLLASIDLVLLINYFCK